MTCLPSEQYKYIDAQPDNDSYSVCIIYLQVWLWGEVFHWHTWRDMYMYVGHGFSNLICRLSDAPILLALWLTFLVHQALPLDYALIGRTNVSLKLGRWTFLLVARLFTKHFPWSDRSWIFRSHNWSNIYSKFSTTPAALSTSIPRNPASFTPV